MAVSDVPYFDVDENGTSIENDKPQLPVDVIMKIMSYLSVSDRMCAGLVCRDWHDVSLSSKYIDKQVLVVRSRGSEVNLRKVLGVLEHSQRPFHHFVFKGVNFKRNLPIWDHFGPNTRSLALICCSFRNKTLMDILKRCKNLRALHINACLKHLMSRRLVHTEWIFLELSSHFQSLVHLSLSSNDSLSDALFNKLVLICPNLQSLSLFECHISFRQGLYETCYPNADDELTFMNVLQYIKRQVKRLKHLNFGSTEIDSEALSTLVSLENLKLESLRLRSCNQLTSGSLRHLAYQTTLKELDLSYCTRVMDSSLVCISQNLINLESLDIRRCQGVTDLGVSQLNNLQKLRALDISECDQLTSQCITEGLCRAPKNSTNKKFDDLSHSQNSKNVNPNVAADPSIRESSNVEQYVNHRLEMFSASALKLDEKSIESIATCFPQLRLLDVGLCFSAVTDKTIQTICKELIFLRTLRISRCYEMSDAGLTGMGAGSRTKISPPMKIEKKAELPGSKLRIRLGSRAEEEIVRDANGKREVMQMCEDSMTPLDHEISAGFSLIRLRGIRALDLSGCNRITDVSLKHAFNFPELRILDLSMCQQISDVGLDHLTKNNPAIEELNLSRCDNVTDTGILYVAERLHRLKRLHLQNCLKVTTYSRDFIKFYHKKLQYLDLHAIDEVRKALQRHKNCSEKAAMASYISRKEVV